MNEWMTESLSVESDFLSSASCHSRLTEARKAQYFSGGLGGQSVLDINRKPPLQEAINKL